MIQAVARPARHGFAPPLFTPWILPPSRSSSLAESTPFRALSLHRPLPTFAFPLRSKDDAPLSSAKAACAQAGFLFGPSAKEVCALLRPICPLSLRVRRIVLRQILLQSAPHPVARPAAAGSPSSCASCGCVPAGERLHLVPRFRQPLRRSAFSASASRLAACADHRCRPRKLRIHSLPCRQESSVAPLLVLIPVKPASLGFAGSLRWGFCMLAAFGTAPLRRPALRGFCRRLVPRLWQNPLRSGLCRFAGLRRLAWVPLRLARYRNSFSYSFVAGE